RQIGARRRESSDATQSMFGWPDAVLALCLAALYALSAIHPAGRETHIVLTTSDLIFNGLISASVFLLIAVLLKIRGFSVSTLAGFSKLSFARTLLTACILLFAAYPLITLA